MQRCYSSEFFFEEKTGDHLEVNLHLNEFAPALNLALQWCFMTEKYNFLDQIDQLMLVEILHLLVSEILDAFFGYLVN